MALKRIPREKVTFPGKIKKNGTGYFIPIPKEYMELMELDLEGMVQFDVTVQVISRPIEELDEIVEDDDD